MRIITIVQARCGSSRMPGKSLKPLSGKPLVLHALERARAMGYVTWLSTTEEERDALLADMVVAAGFPVYRGSERDVLARMFETALAAQADAVIRVTGDCPLLAPDVGGTVVDEWTSSGGKGIATNDTATSGWPDGTDVEVFSMAMMARAVAETSVPDGDGDRREADKRWRDREHVTPWMRRSVQHTVVKCQEDWSKVKLSVDTEDDFARVESVMAQIGSGPFDWWTTRQALFDLKFAPAAKQKARA